MTRRYVLTFPPEIVDEPVTYTLIKNYDLKINILKAEINPGKEGNLLIEFESEKENLNRGLKYLQGKNITCLPIAAKIMFNQTHCIHCGGCTAVCFSEALIMDKISWELIFDPEKCVACGLCIKACPLGLFQLDF
jgi:ferredoxin